MVKWLTAIAFWTQEEKVSPVKKILDLASYSLAIKIIIYFIDLMNAFAAQSSRRQLKTPGEEIQVPLKWTETTQECVIEKFSCISMRDIKWIVSQNGKKNLYVWFTNLLIDYCIVSQGYYILTT